MNIAYGWIKGWWNYWRSMRTPSTAMKFFCKVFPHYFRIRFQLMVPMTAPPSVPVEATPENRLELAISEYDQNPLRLTHLIQHDIAARQAIPVVFIRIMESSTHQRLCQQRSIITGLSYYLKHHEAQKLLIIAARKNCGVSIGILTPRIGLHFVPVVSALIFPTITAPEEVIMRLAKQIITPTPEFICLLRLNAAIPCEIGGHPIYGRILKMLIHKFPFLMSTDGSDT